MKNREKYARAWLSDFRNGELLFSIGFVIYLAKCAWWTTTFPFPEVMQEICLNLSLLLIVLKILFFDSYRARLLFLVGVAIVWSVLVYHSSAYWEAFFWIVLAAGSKDISFEKILKLYLTVVGSIVFLAVCASLLGVIRNYQYPTSDGIRNSFGIIYTTDFAAHIFYLVLVFFFIRGGMLRWHHYAGTLALSGIVYYYCRTRLDCASMVLTVLVFGLGNWLGRSECVCKNSWLFWEKTWRAKGIYSMPLLALVSLAATLLYRPEHPIWSKLNAIFSGRLSLGKLGIEKYGYQIFGQTVKMAGMGGRTTAPEDYFFVDCSYLYILLRYGVVFAVGVVAAYTIACYQRRYDLYFLYAIALVAVNCTTAQHLLEIEHNPFALALLARHSGCLGARMSAELRRGPRQA